MMKSKILKTFCALAAVSGAFVTLSSCKDSLQERLEMTAGDGEKMIEYAYISYDDMISFIVEGYQCHWTFDTTPECYGMSNIYCYESPTMGFVKMDINGDGVIELIFGENPDCVDESTGEPAPTVIYDIMTIDTQKWERCCLASGGERDRFYLTDSGYIVEEGSNSASESFTKIFKIKENMLVRKLWKVRPGKYLRLELEPFIKYAKPQHLCGGWSEERAPEAEDFEVLDKYYNGADYNGAGARPQVVTVSTQVVAGLNYRFTFADGSVLVLYRDLQGNISKLQ